VSAGRLIAFDLDGTLVDSRKDLADSASQLVVELGGRPLTEDEVVGMVGEGASLLVRRALAAACVPDHPAALDRFLEIYDERLLRHTRLYPGVRGMVERARTMARVTVLTNKPRRHTERLLEGLRIRHLFAEVIGGDGPYPRKPSPDGLRALMAAAGAGGRTSLMIGDSLVDLETARAAGTACCVVAWGFGFARIPPDRLPPAEYVMRDAKGLASCIDAFVNGRL
jgi:phosphoglycolate phosphatase